MKAIVREKPGEDFSTLRIKAISNASLYNNQVRIKVKSSRVNPIDMQLMKGFPSVKYQTDQVAGISGSGEIVEVGKNVERFVVGDAVFFHRKFTDIGTWAEEIVVRSQDVAIIPEGMSLEEAGVIVLPLLTAYESLRSLEATPEETILIHGAGGGVGFIAAQIAKQMGMSVVAHASGADQQMLEQIGVDRFINYKITDFYQELIDTPPDYILDVVGGSTLQRSIQLHPKIIVSTVLADARKLKKTGVRLNWFQEWLFQRMGRSFFSSARKQKVRLIAQVTAADGSSLQEASECISRFDFIVKPYERIDWDRIQKAGLRFDDVGRVLVF